MPTISRILISLQGGQTIQRYTRHGNWQQIFDRASSQQKLKMGEFTGINLTNSCNSP
ncbi:hypothetical protein [Nostoc sp.]|uniref:hypothetical protein n=1 Tax=Nostoc sp. TaxID=1180 RepID=UPI002FF7F3F4